MLQTSPKDLAVQPSVANSLDETRIGDASHHSLTDPKLAGD